MVSWQMRGVMIGHILMIDLRSMKQVQIMFQIWPIGMNYVIDCNMMRLLIKLLSVNLRKKRITGERFCSELLVLLNS
uniref:Uncharacterized protein n=1 Tax=Arundo donax TaxID=35708 RepID=A0A0A9BXU1_ARUDO